MRIMGLDIGTKNIGVAVSDESGTIAQARQVVKRVSDEKAVGEIQVIAGEFSVKEIVVGLPVHMDGSMGERAEDSKRFASLLEDKLSLPVVMWDERLSTKEMEEVLISASVRRKKRKMVIDKLAAQIILQGYLDSRNREETDV
ncbi:MAG: Holliday junction resolvase RuvX [Candidatus Omnitrophota bacterium]